MKRILGSIIILLFALSGLNAQDSIPGMTFKRFYFPGGTVSSEGYLRDGKPDGYWKSFYEDGTTRIEGNRKDFELDGTWKFYDENGQISLSIDYVQGLKEGKRITYGKNERMEENFIADVKQGWTTVYYNEGQEKSKVFFKDGREEGMAYEYDPDGTVISLTEYRNGFVLSREQINRRDRMGRMQGMWKQFWPNGNVRLQGTYKNDLKDGYFKEYDKEGNLDKVTKFINGEEIVDAVEVAEYEIRRDYYPDGRVKVVGTYKDNRPHGVRKEFDREGNITVSYIFSDGVMQGMGIIDEQGKKQGNWKEYYSSGQVMAEGRYVGGVKSGEWVYYYRNGRVEQRGLHDSKGRPDGIWIWYYPSGKVQREEQYVRGMLDGMMTEFREDGDTISHGEYIEDLEEGKWFTSVNDNREEGTYVAGAREGLWKSSYPDGILFFKGKYVADLPNGKHVWYWDNGNIRLQGSYVMGVKEGDWKRYDIDGTLLLTVYYQNGIEVRYDGTRVEPELDPSEIE